MCLFPGSSAGKRSQESCGNVLKVFLQWQREGPFHLLSVPNLPALWLPLPGAPGRRGLPQRGAGQPGVPGEWVGGSPAAGGLTQTLVGELGDCTAVTLRQHSSLGRVCPSVKLIREVGSKCFYSRITTVVGDRSDHR